MASPTWRDSTSAACASAIENARRARVRSSVSTPRTSGPPGAAHRTAGDDRQAQQRADLGAHQHRRPAVVRTECQRVLRAHLQGCRAPRRDLRDQGAPRRVLPGEHLRQRGAVRGPEHRRAAHRHGGPVRRQIGDHPVREPAVQHPRRRLQGRRRVPRGGAQ
ncbi:hypothetical protein [Streptomyces somaliensis]|uniref:hypothetical protein n=1 Tax=Streptomyces somaliensis TaxID=78355 RepID=UPI0034E956E6